METEFRNQKHPNPRRNLETSYLAGVHSERERTQWGKAEGEPVIVGGEEEGCII
jgi:hypothetical protein